MDDETTEMYIIKLWLGSYQKRSKILAGFTGVVLYFYTLYYGKLLWIFGWLVSRDNRTHAHHDVYSELVHIL